MVRSSGGVQEEFRRSSETHREVPSGLREVMSDQNRSDPHLLATPGSICTTASLPRLIAVGLEVRSAVFLTI